jgi:hypothetical protein
MKKGVALWESDVYYMSSPVASDALESEEEIRF